MERKPEPLPAVGKKKVEPFIWGLLLGMLLQWIIIGFVVKPFLQDFIWSVQHPKEMDWAIERYALIQKASHVLYFEDEMTGVTIVKPQMMN